MQRNDLTPEELERLEALARAATPGPWTVIPGDADSGTARGQGHVLTNTPEDWTRGVIAISHVFHERDAADWTFIAVTHPGVVLALVAAAKALPEWRADSERLRAERAQVREVLGASPADGHIEAARRVVGERDQLRAEVAALKAPPLPPASEDAQDIVDDLLRANLQSATTKSVLESPTIKGLRAEVERLRDLALDAVDVIEEATTPTNKLAAALRVQIERKP